MKIHSEFICQQCGYHSSSFLGKCPECGSWNSLVETEVSAETERQRVSGTKFEESIVKLAEVKKEHSLRRSTGFSEFDRVLGGGIVPGSLVLISGDPGIGKSTLLLQSAMRVADSARGPVSFFPPTSAPLTSFEINSSKNGEKFTSSGNEKRAVGIPSRIATPRKTSLKSNVNGKVSSVVLYVTGEESAQQVKIRADRVGKIPPNLYILPQTQTEAVVSACEKLSPAILIVDSIQTLTSEKLTGSAGSIGQIRESAQVLQRLAKGTKTSVFVVGHVTKEGNIAGPKVLEHIVDAVLNLEGDEAYGFRILRSVKNRFGSTFEVGVFEMADSGMIEITNPSQVFLSQRIEKRAGSVVCASIAGGRPILSEVQALSTSTIFGVPARRVTGLDFSRMQIVIAALAKNAGLSFANLDIYLNVAGGLRITEPAADLAAALAVVSAVLDKPVKEGICVFGEVGLLGELRTVAASKAREKEAKRLGFDDFVTPERFKTLEAAIGYAIHGE